VLTEPTVFDQNEDDGTVMVLIEEPEGDQLEAAREAVNICPSQALSLAE
jgi:ferredoxin